MASDLKVLLFTRDSNERAKLQKTLASYGDTIWVSSLPEMTYQLGHANYNVVLCARSLADNTWREILNEVLQLDPNLPVVVLSPTADEAEWAEVLAAGAFDLVGPFYHELDLFPVLEQALASYEARIRHMHRLRP